MQCFHDIGDFFGVDQFSANDKSQVQFLIKVSVPQGGLPSFCSFMPFRRNNIYLAPSRMRQRLESLAGYSDILSSLSGTEPYQKLVYDPSITKDNLDKSHRKP